MVLFCGTECQSHYILMVCHDGCPSAGIGWCVLENMFELRNFVLVKYSAMMYVGQKKIYLLFLY